MSTKQPQILDEPPVPRRRRGLNAEERALWDAVAKQVKPLRKLPKLLLIPPAPAARDSVKPKAVSRPSASTKPVKPRLDAPRIAPPLSPIGRREKSSLSRGKTAIEARIDLHGMTQHAAHAALLSFLYRASHDNKTFVLVITGKGITKGRTRGSESERGILRRQVPLWLSLPEFRTLVIGYDEAGLGHGGEGALYVRVRRGR